MKIDHFLSIVGVVFSIPFPPAYETLVAYLGVFSLHIFSVMPIDCSIDLNHSHVVLIRTLLPICFILATFGYRRRLLYAVERQILRANRDSGASASVEERKRARAARARAEERARESRLERERRILQDKRRREEKAAAARERIARAAEREEQRRLRLV